MRLITIEIELRLTYCRLLIEHCEQFRKASLAVNNGLEKVDHNINSLSEKVSTAFIHLLVVLLFNLKTSSKIALRFLYYSDHTQPSVSATS